MLKCQKKWIVRMPIYVPPRANTDTDTDTHTLSGTDGLDKTFLPLEPPPSEADYSFGLDFNEGACDLFDFSF